MALHNVRERLRLLHDVAASCEPSREGGLFHVRIVLPLD
jgi:two-component system sensor histidine kinase AlgZ